MIKSTPERIAEQILCADRLWLFLDYDGTLAEFAPTPDRVEPKPEVIDLLRRMSCLEHIQLAVISGRPLAHVQRLVPAFLLVLAGTYGIELQLPDGAIVYRAKYSAVRPTLEQLKVRWQALVAGQHGFFIEDKGWALALHARFAEAAVADQVLAAARSTALASITSNRFRLLNGQRFFEVAPVLAHKGRTVEYLLNRLTCPGALPLYLGDDDKDEEAFEVIHAHRGLAMLIAAEPRATHAQARLPSPRDARHWLAELARHLKQKAEV
ncbi:MAG TPA: trehalose-phosphatase [Anaerolineae bacterium]|nr:trehalose-phosphatase [Anaerolineae bacterium]